SDGSPPLPRKLMRNACGVTTAIPRNVWSASKSPSPLRMWLALPLTANSKNLLSLGSRQVGMTSLTSTSSPSCPPAPRHSPFPPPCHKSPKEPQPLLPRNLLFELRPPQHFIQFGDGRLGHQQLPLDRCCIERLPRHGTGQQYGADDNARVNDGSSFI